MLYKLSKKQILAESNKIRGELHYERLNKAQKKYLWGFFGKHKKIIYIFIFLTIVETIVELALPTISHFYLEKSFDLMNYKTFLFVGISLIILIIIFLINSYFRIFLSQKISIELINSIRESWFYYFLKQTEAIKEGFDGKKLMTKILYHVQLLRMGFQNILTEGIQGILLYVGILAFSFVFNPRLFIVLWFSIPVLLLIFVITDYIGKYFVAREQTFNSRIVGHLADSLINYDILKAQAREEEQLKEFENLINLDTHFRIRRQLWIRYSTRVLYGVILMFGVALYFIQIYFPFLQFDSLTNIASTGIILGFFVRLLFSAARVGIFFEAFMLGIRLSTPKFYHKPTKHIQKFPKWNKLSILSQKTKLSKYGGYIKDFNLTINQGENISIISEGRNGKTTLARIITGHKYSQSVFIKLDKTRITSFKWTFYRKNNYLITANPYFDTTIGEILFSKDKTRITHDDIQALYETLSHYKIFDYLVKHKDLLGKRITKLDFSFSEVVLLQIAHCILQKKSIIAFDHLCIDSANNEIIDGMKILHKLHPKTSLIVFSKTENNYLTYDKSYKLHKTGFTKI